MPQALRHLGYVAFLSALVACPRSPAGRVPLSEGGMLFYEERECGCSPLSDPVAWRVADYFAVCEMVNPEGCVVMAQSFDRSGFGLAGEHSAALDEAFAVTLRSQLENAGIRRDFPLEAQSLARGEQGWSPLRMLAEQEDLFRPLVVALWVGSAREAEQLQIRWEWHVAP